MLRANPDFFHQPRYDFVLIKVYDDVYLFAQLQYIFGITIEEQTYYMALILPLDEPIPRHERSSDDTDLRLIRLRARARKRAVFINVESIVRGALLTRDHDSNYDDEFFLITAIDQDMWWRNKSLILPSRRAEI